MKKKEEVWEPCPRCGSNKVVKSQIGCLFAFVGICVIGVFFWVTLFIPPLGIIGMLAGVLFLVLSPILGIGGKNMLMCQDCKKSWKFKPET